MSEKEGLLNEAQDDLTEAIEWIHAEMDSPVQTVMRREDWNWLLERLKSARTIIYNEKKRREGVGRE